MAQSKGNGFRRYEAAIITIPVPNADVLCLIPSFDAVDLTIDMACLSKWAKHNRLRSPLSREWNNNVLCVACESPNGVIAPEHLV